MDLDQAINLMAQEMVCKHHGNGAILKTNYNHDWTRDKPRHALDLWVLDTVIPGTTAQITIIYFCAINTVGSFSYTIVDKNTDATTIHHIANELWTERYYHYLKAIEAERARIASITRKLTV